MPSAIPIQNSPLALFGALPTSSWNDWPDTSQCHRENYTVSPISCIDRQAEAVVLSLARSIEARDVLTEGHSQRLAEYSVLFGKRIGLRGEELAALRMGSLVHDIGKIAVPDVILFKAGPLTPAERKIVEQHPIVGERICAPLKSFHEALPAIRHHHERIDGSGYPDGLIGNEIPLTARVLQIVDIYDALTTDRPYRKALPPEWAMAVMMSEAHRGWLDYSLVCQFSHIWQTAGYLMSGSESLSGSCTGRIESVRGCTQK
jgi:putative two-component system response regulator